MAWPLSQDYNEAIQNPQTSFADPELLGGQAVTNGLGLPMPRSGNFADVYQFNGASGTQWAIKCFTRQIPGLQERYVQISQYLHQVKLPFMVDFTFLDRGIRVRGHWYPVLKMQWVEGFTLNEFVKSQLDKPQTLEVLCNLWVKLARRLREAHLAHCDLQHGNVLLVPGSKIGSLGIKLVDYDGMCVPALTLLKSIEVGHPSYQHPQRLREGGYSLEVDRFSHLVIYTALRSLVEGGHSLWDRYDNGDNLLFCQKDLEAPGKSPLFRELLQFHGPEVAQLAETLSWAAQGPAERAPLLGDLVAEERSYPRFAQGSKERIGAVGVTPNQASVPEHLIPEAPSVSFHLPDDSFQTSQNSEKWHKNKFAFWVIGAGFAGLLGIFIPLILVFSRHENSTNMNEAVQKQQSSVAVIGSQESNPKTRQTQVDPESNSQKNISTTVVQRNTQPAVIQADPLSEIPRIHETRRFLADKPEGTRFIYKVAFSPDGRFALAGGNLGNLGHDRPMPCTLWLWNVETGQQLLFYDEIGEIGSMAFSPDGRRILAGGVVYGSPGGGAMFLLDVKSGKKLHCFFQNGEGLVRAVGFSPDGKRVYSADYGKIRVWDINSGAELNSFGKGRCYCAAFSHDGSRVIMGGPNPAGSPYEDNTLYLWDIAAGKELRQFEGHTNQVRDVVFSLDDRHVLSSGGEDKTIRLWDVETGREEVRVELDCKMVNGVALSPDSRFALSACSDNTARLYDMARGKELFRFEGHTSMASGNGGGVFDVAFSPDGRQVLSGGGYDYTMRLWDIPPSLYSTIIDPKSPGNNDVPGQSPEKIQPQEKADPLNTPQVKEGRNISASALHGLRYISANAREDMFQGLASGNNKPSARLKEPDNATNLSQRQKRVLRWTMMFDQVNDNGQEYLKRLVFFKAILVVPRPTGGYELIDLAKKPYKPKLASGDDLSQLRRIFWTESDPRSAALLSSGVGLRQYTSYVVMFFPEWVEKELLEKELAYRHKEEDDIQETKFLIQQSGNSYVPVVVDQR